MIRADTTVTRLAIETYQRARAEGQEDILCLYGDVIREDTMTVLRLKRAALPEHRHRTPYAVTYTSCPNFGDYVGRWHTHLGAPSPAPSEIDEMDFWMDRHGAVMLIGFALAIIENQTVLLNSFTLQDRRRGFMPWRTM